jgi:hypothetical protein
MQSFDRYFQFHNREFKALNIGEHNEFKVVFAERVIYLMAGKGTIRFIVVIRITYSLTDELLQGTRVPDSHSELDFGATLGVLHGAAVPGTMQTHVVIARGIDVIRANGRRSPGSMASTCVSLATRGEACA